MTDRPTRLAESLKGHPPAQLAEWLEEIHRIGDHRVQAKIEGWAAAEPPRAGPKLPGSLAELLGIEPLAGSLLESMTESVGDTAQMEAVARVREGGRVSAKE